MEELYKLTNKDVKELKERYRSLYSVKEQNFSLWNEIGRYCRIEKRFVENKNSDTSGENLDSGLNDPSSLLAINSSANNLYGILIGDGNFFNLVLSDELKEKVGEETDDVNKFLFNVSKRVLRQINKPESNFKNALLEHLKDQQTFGTSGIGTFVNEDYLAGKSNRIFDFLPFGVDNITIDEGKNEMIDTIFIDYNWRINKIVKTFCCEGGKIDIEKFDRLPDKIKASYKEKPNDKYNIQLAIVQNDYFKLGVEGKLGCKYIGIYYMPDVENYVLKVEHYKNNPLNIVRANKVRGELYGRADATTILSFIKMLNYCMADAVETVDKIIHPPLAVVDGSLTGDKVIDTSPNTATVVRLPQNSSQPPIFNLQDIGDPSPLLNVILPYLRETVSTAFKVDILLDNNNTQAKTATEMIQRYNIRSKLLFSMVSQQVDGLLIPLINYCIQIMYERHELGRPQEKDEIIDDNSNEVIIPDIIEQYIREGKDWYKIEFNTEVAKMGKSQELENISQKLQVIAGIAQLNPDILQAVEWYDILSRVEYLLSNGDSYLISKNKYNKIIEDIRSEQAQAMEQQSILTQAETNRNNAIANKNNAESKVM